jgi:malonate transporter
MLLAFYAGAFAAFGLGVGRAYLAQTPEDAMAIGFVCLFSNSLLLGMPITERAYGPDALAATLPSSRSIRRCFTPSASR